MRNIANGAYEVEAHDEEQSRHETVGHPFECAEHPPGKGGKR
jgi:hypothetical protein